MQGQGNPLSGPWIDISRPLVDGTPVWPGDPGFVINRQEQPDFVVSSFSTTCHVGTHVDAPLHINASENPVDQLPIEVFLGPAEVIDLRSDGPAALLHDLPQGWRPQTERVLIRTNSHPLGAEIGPGFKGLSPAVVAWLGNHHVRLVGIDAPSIDPFDEQALPTHHELVRRGLVWIEGLWLEQVDPGLYLMIGLPLPLVGTDAAPMRVMLQPMTDKQEESKQ